MGQTLKTCEEKMEARGYPMDHLTPEGTLVQGCTE